MEGFHNATNLQLSGRNYPVFFIIDILSPEICYYFISLKEATSVFQKNIHSLEVCKIHSESNFLNKINETRRNKINK
jgi:hypothetical protein